MITLVNVKLRDQLEDAKSAITDTNEDRMIKQIFKGESGGTLHSNRKLAVKELAEDDYLIVLAEGERQGGDLTIVDCEVDPESSLCNISLLEGGTVALTFKDFAVNFDGNTAIQLISSMIQFVEGLVRIRSELNLSANNLRYEKDNEESSE